MQKKSGLLLHLTHYDPQWYVHKKDEKKIDIKMMLNILDEMKIHNLNFLILDCGDGVEYKTHPDLKRHYSISQKELILIKQKAFENNIDIVPKLNFSHSYYHKHNDWFRPYNQLFDSDEYWKHAFQIIDELIFLLKPKRYFHIGMDEDHERSSKIYLKAILTLQNKLKKEGLQAVMWNDSAMTWPTGKVHAEKVQLIENEIPRDVIQIVWNYSEVHRDIIERLKNKNFEVWIAPGNDIDKIKKWKKAVSSFEEIGFVLTFWEPCSHENHKKFISGIKDFSTVLKN